MKEANREFEDTISRDFKANNNFCLIVQRGQRFESAGRVHTLEQSKQIDAEIQQLLTNENIPFGVYRHHSINKAIDNMIRVHWGREQASLMNNGTPVPETPSLSDQIQSAETKAGTAPRSGKLKKTSER